MNYLKKIRVVFALLFFSMITLLFLDFTGTLHYWFGWMVKIQFMPAIMALNVAVIAGLAVMTLLFGRLYCSVICPLGIFQDLFSRLNRKKNRFSYSPAIAWLRYGMLGLFVVALVAGIGSLVALLDPYSAYGRIVSNIFAPFWQWGNNLLAYFAERTGSYAFYEKEVWLKNMPVFLVALATFIAIVVLAWRNGRIYCNTICPVGTVLGFLSNLAFFRPRIDLSKCNNCGLCAKNCKASCIDSAAHRIDYSRCVTCFDCLEVCRKKAIRYEFGVSRQAAVEPETIKKTDLPVNEGRRKMLTVGGALTVSSLAMAQQTKVDGGLAFIVDKKRPVRQTPIVPPGANSLRNFNRRCTGCQLCVSVCPNQVLRPAVTLATFMQPEVSYERGYCRPECTLCSEICPAGAINPVTAADKSAIQIGRAVWIEKNCVVLTDGVSCGNCARHCPVGAISMIERGDDSAVQLIPMIDTERCIGCGACENLCPARPFSAIYVEGNLMHRTV